jgi:hypothetical protein
MRRRSGKFIVDVTTVQGRVCERYQTYAEAARRVDGFDTGSLVGPAYIFEELPDGSERLVRQDGKTIQVHRALVEDSRECPEEPIPLTQGRALGEDEKPRVVELKPPDDGWHDPL